MTDKVTFLELLISTIIIISTAEGYDPRTLIRFGGKEVFQISKAIALRL